MEFDPKKHDVIIHKNTCAIHRMKPDAVYPNCPCKEWDEIVEIDDNQSLKNDTPSVAS